MIEILRNFPDNVVAISCEGQVTKENYERIFIPAVLDALKRHEKIRLLYETSQISQATMQVRYGRTSRSAWNILCAGSVSRWSQRLTGSYKR